MRGWCRRTPRAQAGPVPRTPRACLVKGLGIGADPVSRHASMVPDVGVRLCRGLGFTRLVHQAVETRSSGRDDALSADRVDTYQGIRGRSRPAETRPRPRGANCWCSRSMCKPVSDAAPADGAEGLGYLLEQRMAAVRGSFDALTRATGVGTALDFGGDHVAVRTRNRDRELKFLRTICGLTPT